MLGLRKGSKDGAGKVKMPKGYARYARVEGIVMKSFGLLWLANGGVPLQDSEPVVLQKEIWRVVLEKKNWV